MSVVSMVVGNTTADGATFVAKVDGGGPVRVAVADNAGMNSPTFTSAQPVDAQGVAKVSVSGLGAAAAFWWRVEDNGVVDISTTGQFRTLPPPGVPASFTVAVSACAGGQASVPGATGAELAPSQVSNHPAFDTIRQRGLSEGWQSFVHLGDLHYYHLGSDEHGIVGGGSLSNYRRAYDDVLLQPRQHALYRELDWWYQWDDNDFDGNNSDGTFVDKSNALQVYGERVPHGALDGSNGIYRHRQYGRVLFLASDTRYLRSPDTDPDGPSKTMLGAAQKTWMEDVLSTSGAEMLVWLMPSQWMRTSGEDTWGSFATERDELVQMFGDLGWLNRMCMVYGDRHAVAIDSGGSNQWGRFPVMQAASVDSNHGANITGLMDVLDDTGGRGQYGTVAVTDLGNVISVRLSAWRETTLLGTHQFARSISPPVTAASGALLRTLSGSHASVVEARVVTGHPTGDDPAGTDVPVTDGDVILDATAEVRGMLRLGTLGLDEESGRSRFPRMTTDLLGPWGNEVFVRYVLDLGGAGILRIPLGYYRIETPDQSQAPFAAMTIAGKDRMAGIAEADLLQPRSYGARRTIGSVVEELVTDVYPGAVILWDDDSDQVQLGRVLVAEESRYEALRDIVDSQGKIMYWDGEGVLRIETAPDETEPVWEVRAGHDGVLVTASRRVTRLGVSNAIILTGEVADDSAGVRVVVYDNNPQSPTYFHGAFGQVPRRVESTVVGNEDEARTAAFNILRRSLGAPYNVDFTAVTNPTLRPYDPVRVTYRDGTREIHVMQRVTIPLSTRPMSGTTRHHIQASIGSLS